MAPHLFDVQGETEDYRHRWGGIALPALSGERLMDALSILALALACRFALQWRIRKPRAGFTAKPGRQAG